MKQSTDKASKHLRAVTETQIQGTVPVKFNLFLYQIIDLD